MTFFTGVLFVRIRKRFVPCRNELSDPDCSTIEWLKTLVDFSNLVTHSFVKKYESYVSGAAAALKLILKNFGTVIRTNIDSPSTSVGVDISKVGTVHKGIYCSNEKRGGSGR
jgi:hypothetical protein